MERSIFTCNCLPCGVVCEFDSTCAPCSHISVHRDIVSCNSFPAGKIRSLRLPISSSLWAWLNGGVVGPPQNELAAMIDMIRALTPGETLHLIHLGAAGADSENNYGVISVWKKCHGKVIGQTGGRLLVQGGDGSKRSVKGDTVTDNKNGSVSLWSNLGGFRADHLEVECALNSHILEEDDIYVAINTMAWFPETKLGVNKRTGWHQWKRRSSTTRYLNTVAVDLDFHDVTPPAPEEMLAMFDGKREQLGLPEPNIIMFSGRGVWGFWLLAEEDGTPSVRAWPLALDDWLNLQSKLVDSFGFRADRCVKDAARLTRVPGSTNSHTGAVVRAFLCSVKRYTMRELSTVLKVKSVPNAERKSLRHQAAGRARVAYLLKGLDQILECIWSGRIPLGHRRDFLWTYARVLKMNRWSKPEIFDRIKMLGDVALPPVDARDVARLVTSAIKRVEWQRSFSYKGIFSKFQIRLEQRALITAWVRPEVDKVARRAALREQRLATRAIFDGNVAQLRNHGLRRAEIAAQLKCSVRKVADSLKRLGLTRPHSPRGGQSEMTLVGSKAKYPITPATDKSAQFETHDEQRRELVRAPVCITIKNTAVALNTSRLRLDQQVIAQASPGNTNDNTEDRYVQSRQTSATQSVSGDDEERARSCESVDRQGQGSARLLVRVCAITTCAYA